MPHKDPEKRKAYHQAYEAKRRNDPHRKRYLQKLHRKMYRKNKEVIQLRHKQYYDAHKSDWRKRHAENRPQKLQRMRDRYYRERGKYNRERRLDRKRNPEKYRLQGLKKWRLHADKIKVRHREWYRKNYAKFLLNVINRHRRIKIRTVGDPKSIADFYLWVRESSVILCHWCGRPVPRRLRHVDHKIPLAKGGKHCVANLVPSCRSCNCRKHASMPEEFSRILKIDGV